MISDRHRREIPSLTANNKAGLRKQQKRTHTKAHTQGHSSEGQIHDTHSLGAKCG